jgi:hypothetical protein
MMLKLPEPEDFTDHSLIVGDFNMFKQRTIVGGWPNEQ